MARATSATLLGLNAILRVLAKSLVVESTFRKFNYHLPPSAAELQLATKSSRQPRRDRSADQDIGRGFDTYLSCSMADIK